jgi:serine/threonine protein kinase/tetratricopeptide (TPR) repeat protein
VRESKKCSSCGAELPPDAPSGHCPRCLLNLAERVIEDSANHSATDLREPPPQATSREQSGTLIGRYKILEPLGEGGFGVVYVAEQLEPVKRHVALKIIKLGMDTRQFIARFEAERQTLALMDHPNIAKVLDAGATEAGRPYFVMELVRGSKITDYCDQNNLSMRERLGLFVAVCHAVQHAHQKGIIHRDIKPSNILVTMNDGLPVPKVIDFGIAKATSGERPTVFTAFDQFLGTPAYMSPEQAEFGRLDIDTRSDVYSLGVLLYELLTSKTPFDPKHLKAAGLEAMRRIIREEEPVRPSNRVGTLGSDELTTTAKRRSTEVPRLISLLRGDLDWIVLKCLEKDRSRRYETASSLASDILHHLNHEPVLAVAPRPVYRLSKFVRRHRLGITLGFGFVSLLIATAVFSSWMFFRERMALQRAMDEKHRADEQEAVNESVNEFFQDRLLGSTLFAGISSFEAPAGVSATQFLAQAAGKIEGLYKKRPVLEAKIRQSIGDAYYSDSVKLPALAVPQYERALALFRKELAPDHPFALECMSSLADAYDKAGKTNDAVALSQDAIRLCDKKFGPESDESFTRRYRLALMCERKGQAAFAISIFEEITRTISKDPSGVAGIAMWKFTQDLARLYEQDHQIDKAESVYREGLAHAERDAKNVPSSSKTATLSVLSAYGAFLLRQQRFAEAEENLSKALELREAQWPVNWGNFHLQSLRGAAALGQKKFPEAESLLLQGFNGMKELYEDIPIDRKDRVSEAAKRLIELYTAWNKPNKVDEWARALVELEQPARP